MEIKKISGDVLALNNDAKNIVPVDNQEENLSELLSNPISKPAPAKTDLNDKSKNGKFDISEAFLNLGKGLISPLSVLIKHPVLSAATLFGTVYACLLVPVLAPILTAGFGLYSLYQIGKGTLNAVRNYKAGEYDDAEKAFENVGQGIIGTALSALSIKPSARVVREAKLLANGEKITPEISPQLLKSGFLTNLKELGSLFLSKNGIKAAYSQLKPSAIKAKFKKGVLLEIVRNENGKTIRKEETSRRTLTQKEIIEEFRKTPEGIRRANLSEEEIKKEVLEKSEKIFDKMGIPKDQRPTIEVIEASSGGLGGTYNNQNHILEFYTQAYRDGITEMEVTLAHEATHCREALLRAGIPKKRVEEIVAKELLSKARSGEAKQYVTGGGNFCGAEIGDVPKMSPQMREDFYQILKNPSEFKTIKGYRFYDEELAETLLDKYPEFVAQYKSRREAFTDLCKYMDSFEKRFNIFTKTSITKLGIDPKTLFTRRKEIKVPELSGQNLQKAEQSLIDNIDTLEGNARIGGFNGLFAGKEGFNNYLFSPEEILAENNGNGYLIETLSVKLKNSNVSPEEQLRIQNLIANAKAAIEYRNHGRTYYKKYIEHVNNPENAELAEDVKSLEIQLSSLKDRAFPKKEITETKIFEYNDSNLVFNENFTTPFLWSYKFLENK